MSKQPHEVKTPSFEGFLKSRGLHGPDSAHELENGVQISGRLARDGRLITGLLLSSKTGLSFSDEEAALCVAEARRRSATFDHAEITSKAIWP